MFMLHRDTKTQTYKWACVHTCTGAHTCIQACTHTFLLRSTQTYQEVSLHHVGPKNYCCFPPGPACPAGGPKQLPPVTSMPVPSQHKLPPLLNPDENYVIPIEDTPATEYENGDGGWGTRGG